MINSTVSFALSFNSFKIKEDVAWAAAFPREKYTGDEAELTWSTTSLINNPNLNIFYPRFVQLFYLQKGL